jgi:serine/threonine-protein kinase
MGTGYEAIQNSLNRTVAIKVLNPELSKNENIVRRFQREINALAQLDHPNIVRVYERGTLKPFLYFVMEYVKGENGNPQTLRDFISAGTLSSAKVADFAVQIAGALQYAHNLGLVHRDIKPDNVLIDQFGHAKVTDFGIAAWRDNSARTMLTNGSDNIRNVGLYVAGAAQFRSTN